MTLLHRLASMARWLAHRDTLEHDLDDEVRTFVEMSTAEKIRDGVPAAEARRLAVLELGGIEQAKERVRTTRHGASLDDMGRDVRYAFRMFRRHRLSTAIVVVTLALGIGANTAIFTLIDALMLRWLPVRDPHQLVQVYYTSPDSRERGESLSYVIVRALNAHHEIFAGAAGFSGARFNVGRPGSITRVPGAYVTGAFYQTLGLTPEAGRLLDPADDEPGAPVVAVITDTYWERQFGRNPSAVGESFLINGVRATIVGVSPPGFVGANVGMVADITLAAAALAQVEPNMAGLLGAGNFWLRVLARLSPGVSSTEAEARLRAVWPSMADSLIAPHWPPSQRKEMIEAQFSLAPGGTGWTFLRHMYAKPLMVLMVMVGLVLAIACANVASLLLARASARRHEIAVRLAIGAGRARIVRQLLIESVLLSLIGAACGIVLAWLWGQYFVNLISTGPLEVVLDLRPNWHILVFTTTVAIATAVFFGVAPALYATASGPSAVLKDDSRTSAARSRLLPWLVSTQLALSLVLLVGATLFVRTLGNLERFNPGFRSEGVLLIELEAHPLRDIRPIVDAVRSVPGVVSASVSTHTPLSGSIWSEPAVPAGQPLPERDTAVFVGAGPQFFSTMGIPLEAGREFSDHDIDGTPMVAIVNERYAERYFPQKSVVGQRLSAKVRGRRAELEIVGLARNTSTRGLREDPPATVYVPFAQITAPDAPIFPTVEIRAAGAVGQVASAVGQAVRGRLPDEVIDVRTLSSQVEATIVKERMMATLASAFGAIALIVACVGLYGLLACSVARRTKEIGIRMALGAQRMQVVAQVLRGAAVLVAIGIAAGIPAAWAASRWIASMLFELQPTDPRTLLTAISVLAFAAYVAAYVPAHRAARVEPLTALRHE
jgi:putative ABC transport system permease protein